MKREWIIGFILLLFLPIVFAYSPPADSPIGRGEHPRLFFTRDTLPQIRENIKSNYSSEFQDFINTIDRDFSSELNCGLFINGLECVKRPACSWTTTCKQNKANINYGMINYAFLGALDTVEMAKLGFSFKHTNAEYCNRSFEYVQALLPEISNAYLPYSFDFNNNLGSRYIESALAYDWCSPYLGEDDKKKYIEAVITGYKNLSSDLRDAVNQNIIINNIALGQASTALPILAFYGDSFSWSNDIFQFNSSLKDTYNGWNVKLYDRYYQLYLYRIVKSLEYYFSTGANWAEGPDYLQSYPFLFFPLAMSSTALATNYFAQQVYFSDYGLFYLANTKPRLSFKGGIKTYFFNRWSRVGGGIFPTVTLAHCRNQRFTASVINSIYPNMASLLKWEADQPYRCGLNEDNIGTLWENGIFSYFLFGTRNIVPKSPSSLGIPLSSELGMGEYVFRTGYENEDDTSIVFWASDYSINEGAHWDQHYGQFTIEKYGDLIIKGGNDKSAFSDLNSLLSLPAAYSYNGFENVIGLSKSLRNLSNPPYGYLNDYTFDTWSIAVKAYTPEQGLGNRRGNVVGASLNEKGYDYIFYNNTPSWQPKTAKLSQREFLYLRGAKDKEYVLIFDRMNVSDSSNTKIWHIWTPTQPELNGNVINPRIGYFTSDGDTINITNNYKTSDTKGNVYLNNHGRLFIKKLFPENSKINVIGGDWCNESGVIKPRNYVSDAGNPNCDNNQHEFEDVWGRTINATTYATNVKYPGVYHMSDFEHNYMGWGRVEEIPTVASNYDIFLNVMQFGDSNTLKSMSPTTKIESLDERMVGAFIDDPANRWVVIFARNPERITATSYTIHGVGEIKHLIADLVPNSNYNIDDNGVKSVKQTNNAGILYFNSILGSAHTFTISQGELLSCSQLSGTLMSGCASGQVCTGSMTTAKDGTCCLGSCVNPPIPACREGAVTLLCNCGGSDVSSGYCCSGKVSTNPCGLKLLVDALNNALVFASSSQAVFTWETSVPTGYFLDYGFTSDYAKRVTDLTYQTSHTAFLEGLSPGTLYHFKLSSVDSGGVVQSSKDLTFTTSTLPCTQGFSGACCGNGKVETGEYCDDGGQVAGEGCNAACGVEQGFTCTGGPSTCLKTSCKFTKAYWEKNIIPEGESIFLNVEGSGCEGEQVDFTVFRDGDLNGMPLASTTLKNGLGRMAWNVERNCNDQRCSVNPRYYFIAQLHSENKLSMQSNLLEVEKNSFTTPSLETFIRGDANSNSKVELSDAVFILDWLFRGKPGPKCWDRADANDDGLINIADPVLILGYLFVGLKAPPAPFPDLGIDSTLDSLRC